MWTTRAPAKVNLDLRLRGVRSDGYHLVRTVLQSIALADTLTLVRRPGSFGLVCETPGVPTDARNLAWKGAVAMSESLGVSLDGWQLRLEKRVPAEAGLGGGSADAVAAARLVAAGAGAKVSAEVLAGVVRPIGADVAYFAWGGTVLGEGVGDLLTPLPDLPDAQVVVVRPGFGVSTREAYGWYDEAAARSAPLRAPAHDVQPARDVRPAGEPGAAVGGRAVTDAWSWGGNDLERPVAARHPEIAAIVGRLRASGAWLAAMSGSGSACFGLFDPATDLGRLASDWPPGSRVYRTSVLTRATYAEWTRCVASS